MAQAGASDDGREAADWFCVLTDTIHDCPDYTATLDTHYRRDGARMHFMHVEFHKFSPSIFKRVVKDLRGFMSSLCAPVFAIRDDGDERKWHHYVTACGFKPTGTFIPTNAGPLREIYIHDGHLYQPNPILAGSVAASAAVS